MEFGMKTDWKKVRLTFPTSCKIVTSTDCTESHFFNLFFHLSKIIINFYRCIYNIRENYEITYTWHSWIQINKKIITPERLPTVQNRLYKWSAQQSPAYTLTSILYFKILFLSENIFWETLQGRNEMTECVPMYLYKRRETVNILTTYSTSLFT